MKLTLHSFKSEVPSEKTCLPSVDYQVFESSDVGPDEVFTFFDKLIYPRDSFYLEVPGYLLDFWKYEQSIWVEITSAEFWATTQVSCDEAKAIIETLYRGER